MARLLLILLLAAAGLRAGDNLLPNGDFDAGKDAAEHWETPNGLTSRWVDEAGRGRVLEMDTRVLKDQARAWDKTFREDPAAPVPEKQLAGNPGYDSIGGNDGVMLDSEYLDCKPGEQFKLVADVRGPGPAVVWIKGFLFHRGRWRDAYQTRLVAYGATPDQWRRYEILFNPTEHSERVTRFKVRCYAYWPNGIYYFDRIRVERIDAATAARLLAEREIPEEECGKLAAQRVQTTEPVGAK